MSTFPAAFALFAGRLFDGRSAQPHEVVCRIEAGDLLVQRDGAAPVDRHVLSKVVVAEPLSHAPRDFRLADGGVLRIDESPALAAALAAAGVRDAAVVRWQRAWPTSLVALVVLVASAAWLYFEGLPLGAEWAARQLSPSFEQRLGDRVLAALDHSELRPSALPQAQRLQLADAFRAFEVAAGLEPARIEFRRAVSGPHPNAFALPGGTVVFLDGMVALAGADEALLIGVLAHEAGHQQEHHMTRSLFRGLGGVALAGILWGDYSSVASNAAILLGQLRYSRQDEMQADAFAVAALQRGNVSPEALLRLFERLGAAAAEQRDETPDWLSTHPPSTERAERARQAAQADRAGASGPTR